MKNVKQRVKKDVGLFSSTLLLAVALNSCERVVDIELETSPSLIVEGGIELVLEEPNTTQRIQLSLANGFNELARPSPINDAMVTVATNGTDYDFQNIGDGTYVNNNIPVAVGNTYVLTISYMGSLYTAQEVIPPVAPIDEVNALFFPKSFGSDEGVFPVLNTQDPVDEENFYFWRLTINDIPIINPSPGNNFRVIQSDEFFNGQALVDYQPYDLQAVVPGDEVVFFQHGITERYFNFLDAFFLSIASNPLLGDPPPATVRGNIINSTDTSEQVLGYFYAVSISKKSLNVE